MYDFIPNFQGLQDSIIFENHLHLDGSPITQKEIEEAKAFPLNSTLFTIRDDHVLTLIKKMITHPTYPKNVLCLQECSRPLVEALKMHLLPKYHIHITNEEWTYFQQPIVIIDTDQFEILPQKTSSNQSARECSVDLRHKVFAKEYKIVNIHMPGNPLEVQKRKMVLQSVLKEVSALPKSTSIVMTGDWNFTADEIYEDLEDLATKMTRCPGLNFITPGYATNLEPIIFNSTLNQTPFSFKDNAEPYRSKGIDLTLTNDQDFTGLSPYDVLIDQDFDQAIKLLNP